MLAAGVAMGLLYSDSILYRHSIGFESQPHQNVGSIQIRLLQVAACPAIKFCCWEFILDLFTLWILIRTSGTGVSIVPFKQAKV